MKKELICISCPIGCRLTLNQYENGDIHVSGNKCPRGEVYGKTEILGPKRTVTAVVRTNSPDHPYVSVKTDSPLLREYIFPLLKELYRLKVKVPIQRGDILLENFEKSGVNVVCTRSVKY